MTHWFLGQVDILLRFNGFSLPCNDVERIIIQSELAIGMKNFNFVIEHSKTKWLKQATIYVKSSIFICKKQPIEKYKKKERAEIYSL